MTIVALALMAGASWTLGRLALFSSPWTELRRYERLGLELTAGLGLVALLLSLLALAGLFWLATPALLLLSLAGAALAARIPRPPATPAPPTPRWARVVTAVVFACAAIACVGAVTPVSDFDALSYVVPIARHIAETGRLRVWTDQARSMWPLFHEVLLAYVLRLGGDHLIVVTAFEWLAAVGAVSALARRVASRPEHVPVALVLAFGAPVVAFLISTAKEDLLLVAAVAAVGFCLTGPGGRDLRPAGLFAGIAAGTKYPGLGVALGAVVWVAISHRGRRVRAAATVAGWAIAVGGVWYALNLWRFANPVAPFVFGARGTPLDPTIVRQLLDGWGGEHGAIDFFLTPVRLFLDPNSYLGRAALFNPVVYVALVGLGIAAVRRRHAPLFFMAAVLYVGWFWSLENARLLLPAAVLLAPAAAEILVPIVARRPAIAWMTSAALAIPLLLIPVVGVVRAVRYAMAPANFLYTYTERYADIQWANAHLDPRVHRIGSIFPDVGYLEIPFILFAPTYQAEFSAREMTTDDPAIFLAACRRQRVTHLFASSQSYPDALWPHLRKVYDNPASLRGGEHFFREATTEHTVIFEILP